MQQYLSRILLIVFISGIISALVSGSKTEGFVSFAVSVTMLSVILSPFNNSESIIYEFDKMFEISEITESPDYNTNWLDGQVNSYVERGLKEQISSRFSISAEKIELSAVTRNTDNGIIIEKVKINVTENPMNVNVPEIVAYINESCGAECEAKINGK